MEERGLRYVSLTSPSMQWQYQLAAREPEQREKSRQYFINGVHAAAELGCRVMAVNSGWGYNNEPREHAFLRAAESIACVADTAKEDGILLALETLQPIESNLVLTLEDAKRMTTLVNHPSVKLMIDTVAVGVAGKHLVSGFRRLEATLYIAIWSMVLHRDIWFGGTGRFPWKKRWPRLRNMDTEAFLPRRLAAGTWTIRLPRNEETCRC